MIASKISEIWISASIPTIKLWSIIKRIDTLIETYLKLGKFAKRDLHKEFFKTKLAGFKVEIGMLFDVAACKCRDLGHCYCIMDLKVPNSENIFLVDQRGLRKMIISGVDPKVTARNLKKLRRQSEAARLSGAEGQTPLESQPRAGMIDNEEEDKETGIDLQLHKILIISRAETHCPRKIWLDCLSSIQLATTGVFSRSAAIISSAVLVLEDFGLVNSFVLIGRSKLKRQRSNSRSKQMENASKKPSSNR